MTRTHIMYTTTGHTWLVKAGSIEDAENSINENLDTEPEAIYFEGYLDEQLERLEKTKVVQITD